MKQKSIHLTPLEDYFLDQLEERGLIASHSDGVRQGIRKLGECYGIPNPTQLVKA